MSFAANDSSLVAHTLDTETIGSTEMLSHGVKTIKQGGAKPYRSLDVGLTGELINAAVMQLYGGDVWNGHASALRYLKIYDIALPPTASDTPVATLTLKAQDHTRIPSELVGIQFSNGVGIRATTGLADSDTGAPTTNDVIANLLCSSIGVTFSAAVGTCAAALHRCCRRRENRSQNL